LTVDRCCCSFGERTTNNSERLPGIGGNMAKKRISRKQLLKEPDEFLTLSSRALHFAAENRKLVSYVLIGLVAVVLAGALIGYFLNFSERRAYAVFEEGLSIYVAQVSGEKSSPLQETAKEKFSEAIEKHSSTRAAELSLPLCGDVNYEEGSYDKAIELYHKALGAFSKEDDMRKLIWNDLGYAYEGKEDYKSAAEYFKKITSAQGGLLKADACFNLGRMYEAMNDRQEARQAYERLVEEYPESIHFQIAKEKALRLKEQG
jgi:tetratricopeptide (TPR) repeat protein